MSSVTEDGEDGLLINYDTSKGSSVSSGLQEEYDELLKYAIVTPKWEPCTEDHEPVTLPQLRLEEPDQLALTTVDEYTESSDGNGSPKIDGHDSAVGSEEITSDRKTFREMHMPTQGNQPLGGFHVSAPYQAPMQSTTRTTNTDIHEPSGSVFERADPDLKQMSQLVQRWHAKTNSMILAELSQIKVGLVERHKHEVHAMKHEYEEQITKLQDEVENLKELLFTYENSLARKDSVISNLTRAMQTSKERQEMARAMSQWKLRLVDERRQGFTSGLARRYRQHCLTTRAWQAWRSLVEGKWKEKVEKACQKKAQEVCMKLTSDYEARLASADEALQSARKEVELLHAQREKYEETMKKAFMRGVCALNLEAMSMFQGEDDQSVQQDVQTLAAAVDALSCATQAEQPQQEASLVPGHSRDIGRRPVPTNDPNNLTEDGIKSSPLPSQVTSQQQPGTSTYHAQTFARQPTGVIRRPVSRTRTLTAIVTGASRPKTPPAPPAGTVLVERHHPNVQNAATGQPLAHMTKEPNTPSHPIRARGDKQSGHAARCAFRP